MKTVCAVLTGAILCVFCGPVVAGDIPLPESIGNLLVQVTDAAAECTEALPNARRQFRQYRMLCAKASKRQ